MAREQVVQLFRAAQTDLRLREKFNTAPNIEAFVLMARQYGYEFTIEEWKQTTGFAVEELECQVSEIPGL
ncbi:MAG: Nif11-like leader peptide family natural product precursor [Oculatellaceae cyanobacterium Prado106]|jgi:predicted ribosomally synthesized peptide with nif11-like leader|nr:Nif11-like leader peptide family natural product precursor [Oculatellaceae cyanobacterium Prado106]